MSDLPTHQIDWVAFEEQLPHEFAMVAQAEGIVVPDTRLQNIADAWRQEKETGMSDPEITDLLDALLERDNHG